jgi:ribose transport system ATP-binding protein
VDKARLSINNLNKSFSTPVLKDVNFTIRGGEIHAIVGENGAGKSTLVNILTGLLPRDSGEIFLDGVEYDPSGPGDGFAAGISFAAQELSIIETLSVAENIGLRDLPQRNSVILRGRLYEQARNMLRLVGLTGISPETSAESLSISEQQLLELAKALSIDCRLLILDEPTAALTGPQADHLHGLIADISARGTSVIYISHRLNDVLAVADTVSVLRDGQVVTSAPAHTMTVADIFEQMSGRIPQESQKSATNRAESVAVLKVQAITTDELPHAITFTCHKGEIIGIAGLAGAGRSELLEALFGLAKLRGGCVTRCTADGMTVVRNASHAVSEGIGFLAEDRKSMGIFSGLSVLANMTLPGIDKVSSSFGRIDRALEKEAGIELVSKLAIKCDSLGQDIEQLSGGNQQKALIARWLHCDSDIFLLDEPTRGVDVGTKNMIYDLLFELQSRGKTVLVASSEIEELMTVCNRILVLSDRKLVKVFARDEWSESEILAAAFQEFTSHALNIDHETSLRSESVN